MKKIAVLTIIAGFLFVFTLSVQGQDVIWIEDFGVCNTTSIQVPIWFFNDSSTLDTIGFRISFDDSLLTFTGITPSDITTDWEFLGDSFAPGEINVTGNTTSDPIP